MASNIFNSSGNKNQDEFKNKVDTHSKAILGVVERQKNLESSLDNLSEKIEFVDHNGIKNFKKIFGDIKSLQEEARDLRKDVLELKDFNKKITKQLKLFATKDEVAKIDKYVDLWNPMDFATRSELREEREQIKKELREIIEEFLKD